MIEVGAFGILTDDDPSSFGSSLGRCDGIPSSILMTSDMSTTSVVESVSHSSWKPARTSLILSSFRTSPRSPLSILDVGRHQSLVSIREGFSVGGFPCMVVSPDWTSLGSWGGSEGLGVTLEMVVLVRLSSACWQPRRATRRFRLLILILVLSSLGVELVSVLELDDHLNTNTRYRRIPFCCVSLDSSDSVGGSASKASWIAPLRPITFTKQFASMEGTKDQADNGSSRSKALLVSQLRSFGTSLAHAWPRSAYNIRARDIVIHDSTLKVRVRM